MTKLKTFETERLILRPLQMDDLDDLYRLIYADPEVRQYFTNKGYAAEACRVIVQYAFQELKLKRLVNAVLRTNTPSINLMKQLGFKIEENLHPDYDGVVGILNKPMFFI